MQPNERPERATAEQEARLASHRDTPGHKDPAAVFFGVAVVLVVLFALALWYWGG